MGNHVSVSLFSFFWQVSQAHGLEEAMRNRTGITVVVMAVILC
jgi:hypothetical protein